MAAVSQLIAAARTAQLDWAALPWKLRSAHLKKVESYLASHVDEIAEIISRDNGKTRVDALATELLPALLALKYFRKAGKKFLREKGIPGGNLLMFNKRSRLSSVPYGVIGIISPWNYPFAIPFAEVVMALLAGNAVLLKVASDTLAVGAALENTFAAAGLPKNLFNYVVLPGKEAGPAFIEGGVDKLFFTGSTEIGRQLMALAAPRLLPLVLELGGADAAIICADAELDRAARGIIWAGYSNAGQSCGGIQRVIAHQDIYESLVEKLADRVRSLRVGEGSSWDSDIGSMTNKKQKAGVSSQVAACLEAGGRIVARSPYGDEASEDLFFPALLLTDVPETAPLLQDEVFGPVVVVIRARDDEEALRLANASQYGLTGSVWSQNHRKARQLARSVNAGAVMINDHLMSHGLAETPWGGFGDSGLGRTHGEAGFREMLRSKVIVDDILPFRSRNIWWQPYSKKVYLGLRALVQFLAGPRMLDRVRAIPRVLQIFIRYWEKD
ncbi:aldehyde dehydrogenase family protein [Treponema sp.]